VRGKRAAAARTAQHLHTTLLLLRKAEQK
jgi:hypothetical protein